MAVVARSVEEVDEVAGIIHAGGGQSLSAVCDVTDPHSVQAAVDACQRRLGPVDILVNNAGQAHSQPVARMDLEDFRRIIDVNLTGAFIATRAVLPGMLERGFGRVVNVASAAGLRGHRYMAHYCAAKHGLVGLTRALGLEVARKGVTVNAVCPGWVETDMLSDAVDVVGQRTGKSEEEALAAILAEVPTGRAASPEAVAAMVCFVASDTAVDITGAALSVDGGQSAG